MSALRQAQRLAAQLDGVVDLIHIWAPPKTSIPEVVDEARRTAASRLAAFSRRAVDEDLRFNSASLRLGVPAEEIVKHAFVHDYDLIVIGTRGQQGLSRLFLGSVAETVVRTSRRPVLTVQRPVEENREE